jgi:hypothetical protein
MFIDLNRLDLLRLGVFLPLQPKGLTVIIQGLTIKMENVLFSLIYHKDIQLVSIYGISCL